MVRRPKVVTGDVFLTADAVATRLAIKELQRAKIDPRPLLAKAGISLLKLDEEPKRVRAESQILFLEIAADALGDSALGLHLAQHFDLRECGILYYVLAASPNLGEAIRNLVRYLAVSKPTWEFPRLCRGGSKSLTYPAVDTARSIAATRRAAKHTKGIVSMDGLKPDAPHRGAVMQVCKRCRPSKEVRLHT